MIAEQAAQCGYCFNGQIIKGAELLFQNAAAHRRADPLGHERPYLPLRDVSADHGGDSPRGEVDRGARAGPPTSAGGRQCLNATTSTPCSHAASFCKTTGVVIVALQHRRQSARRRRPAPAARRGPVSGPPDRNSVDSYIAIHADNTATLYAGYVELGQGGPTALRQIAAEELDLDFEQMKTVTVDTHVSTEGLTLASRTAAIGGTETRAAAAEARRVLLELAAERLDAPVGDLTTAKGVVSVGGDARRSVTYAELVGDKSFDRTFEQFAYNGGIELPRKNADHASRSRATPTASSALACRGPTSPRRSAAPTDTFTTFVCPGCCTAVSSGRAGKERTASAIPPSSSVDESSIADIPGVQIVRRNNFVGVVAEREWDAVRAASQLKVTWQPFAAALPGHEGLFDSFRSAKTNDLIDTDTGDVDAALARAAHVVSADVSRPVSVARRDGAELRGRRRDGRRRARDLLEPSDLSDALRPGAVARLAARQDPRAVRRGLEHLRQQLLRRGRERGRDPVAGSRQTRAAAAQPRGRARLGQLRPRAALRCACGRRCERQARRARLSGVDPRDGMARNGVAARARHRRRRPAATALPAPGPGGAGLFSVHLSQTDMYDVPNRRIVNHVVTGAGYLRTGALRAPMDPSTFFALEGVMDELAHAAKLDPYEFRKRNISHPRWLAVLEAAADAAKWTPRVAASQRVERENRHGSRHRPSARTTCRRTRAIASPTRRPSSTSR